MSVHNKIDYLCDFTDLQRPDHVGPAKPTSMLNLLSKLSRYDSVKDMVTYHTDRLQ